MRVKKMKKFDINDDLGLEKRQPDTAMNITSIVLGQEVSTIAAEAETEGYGRVYLTYHLSYDANRQGGTVDVQGRAFLTDDSASGRSQGFWEMVDGIIVMRNVTSVQLIRSGVQHINLDIIQFNPLTRTAVIKAYILK
ncbi:MAG: hypothetical protein O3A25_19260 [Acidobacteria bacterium]|nr:hypothetical protein [Acidobacteriota bacterium]